jgi:peptidoglycan hydrolase FlgJ
MDLQYAERLAATADPKAVMALQSQNRDPAVGKAVAEQFGTLLMQRVMQNADGSAIAMTDGVGSGVVNSMFANTIAQTTMSGDQLGLADLLFRSMSAKQQASSGGNGTAPTAQTATDITAAPTSAGHGFSLSAYWSDHGLRPLANSAVHNAPAPLNARNPTATGLALPARNAVVTNAATVTPPSSQPALAPVAANAPSDGNASAGAPEAGATSFLQRLEPLLDKAAQQLGVSPNVLLAQAALETGWGRSVVGNNVFGVKAGSNWQGAQATARTHEVEHGRTVAETAAFRSYGSLAEAVQDFVSLVAGSSRYRAALDAGDNANIYAQALIAGGYATDSNYPAKLAAVAASPTVAGAFSGPIQLLPAGFAGNGLSST